MYPYAKDYMELKVSILEKIINKQKRKVDAARELNVSRPTIDAWLSRYQRFGIPGLLPLPRKASGRAVNRTSTTIEDRVIAVALRLFCDGAETLADALTLEEGITLHPVTVWRILKRRNIRYTTDYPRTKKRWKIQLFAHGEAGKELQLDTSYPYGYKQGKVIYSIIDDATRWSYSRAYDCANAANTAHFLEEAQRRAPFRFQKIRTDQGSEFKARSVAQYLVAQGIEHRLNTPYCPEENGKIERYHRTLKEKGLRFGCNPNKSLEFLQYRLTLFNQYYNNVKRHRGLGMEGMTPMQKLKSLGW